METTEERDCSAAVEMPQNESFQDFSNDLNDPFNCLICLELVHKPVVNGCGHMFCFLCVHLAMSSTSESYCPLCRRQYMHFPRVCEQLHFFLLQAMRDQYLQRCKEAHAEEVRTNALSPQYDDGLESYIDGAASSGKLASGEGPNTAISRTGGERDESSPTLRSSHGDHSSTTGHSDCLPEPSLEECSSFEVQSKFREVDVPVASSSSRITTSGLLCFSCKDLLYRPVVLNCGHVFCEGCVAASYTEQGSSFKCLNCASFHPGAFPSVFLELHHFLNKTYPSDYKRRQHETDLKIAEHDEQNGSYKHSDKSKIKQGEQPKFTMQDIHYGVGCDGCGIYPLMGRRFKCEDCEEKHSYDLCLRCYETGTLLEGRWNQKHTREHHMVEVDTGHQPIGDHFSEVGDSDDMDESDILDNVITIIGRFPTWRSYSAF